MSQTIDVHATAQAPPAAVWALLDDSSTWPDWTPIEVHEQLRPAGPDGLGEERLFRAGRRAMHERIVEREKERRLTYTLLSGLAVRDYRAEISLEPAGGGTSIRWHTNFSPKVPGMGGVYRKALDQATRGFVDGLVAAAERAEGAETAA